MGTTSQGESQDQPVEKITDLTDPYEGSTPKQESGIQRQQRESREQREEQERKEREAQQKQQQKQAGKQSAND